MNDGMLDKIAPCIDMVGTKSTDSSCSNNQTEFSDDEKNLPTATGTVNTSKKRSKASDKLVLDLNDRSKYTKEVSV